MSPTAILFLAVKILVIFGITMILTAYSTLAERKVSAWIQNRYGPNRVGPWGLLQPVADGLKFLFKEEFIPEGANKFLFRLAPAMAAAPALMTMAVVPFTFPIMIEGEEPWASSIADIPIALLFFLAMGSLAVYGILFGGWSSNNKWSLLGGLRSSAQMVSYELAMILSVIVVIMLSGSMNLTEIFLGGGEGTQGQIPLWNIFRFPAGTLSFMVFLIAAFAETNRHPFDLAECDSELVGGFHTEYSSMKFSLFFIGEYAALTSMSGMLALMFLGGPSLFGIVEGIEDTWLRAFSGLAVYLAKVVFFIFLFIWVRWTIPRYRWDQLMHMGWKVLLPIAIANVALAGILVTTGWH